MLMQNLARSDSLGTKELDMEPCSAPEDKNVFFCDFSYSELVNDG